ncbi:MAG: beta-propeller domain-containing protein [Solirubrobacteraceae bacterium]|nr:beta-propeller domain-containing protein [Solirubrobacteraceae bacterium]
MRRILVVLPALALVLVGAPPVADAASAPRLPAFASCTDLLDYARENLDRPTVPPRVGVAAMPGVAPRPVTGEPAPQREGQPVPTAAPVSAQAAPSADATEEFSTTNVQETGIDEPDIVKTDGKRLFVVAGTQLWSYDVTGDVPKKLGTLDLEGPGGEILLRGDRLLLIGDAPVARAAMSIAPPIASDTRLVEIDVRDATAMKIARSMTVPGRHVTARLTDGTARVVLTSPAALSQNQTPTATTAAAAKPGLAAFVPKTVLRSRLTKRTYRRTLVPCRNVRHPRAYAGNDLLTVLSIDLDQGLFDVDRDAVLAGAQVVYASASALYVASRRAADLSEDEVPEGMRTEIHRFDASQRGQTTYASSGSVSGFVLNNYAMSEHNGDLRIASTEEPDWLSDDPAKQESESAVTVLREASGKLVQIGRVGGLGRDERIYAARFIGDVGYLVAFRQVDPLYTLDLRDPTAPKVVGELKITGYSAYLHPIGDDLLLGVGQEATEQGRRLGAQVSVFDVADPARPKRLHQHLLGAGQSQAEVDPHAFLWWPQAKLALLPYETWTGAQADRGMLGLRAGRSEGLTEVGRITHGPAWDLGSVERSVVVGDRVLTVSDLGVAAHRIGGLAPLGFLPFVPAG